MSADPKPATERAQAEQPPMSAIERAVAAAMLSPCQSKRGAIVFDGDTPIARACNTQVSPFQCEGTSICKKTCRHTAIHAEQAALLRAGLAAKGRDMLHVKVVDGELVPSGGPSCAQCSRLIVAAGIRWMWLFHVDGWKRYGAVEFHRLSVAAELSSPLPATEREQAEALLAEMRRAADAVDAAEWATQLRRALEKLGLIAHEFVRLKGAATSRTLACANNDHAMCHIRWCDCQCHAATLPSGERVKALLTWARELADAYRVMAASRDLAMLRWHDQRRASDHDLFAEKLAAALAGKE